MTIYNKLVRDNIPEIIDKNGEKCEYISLDQETYIQELRRKLVEEVNEYLSSTSRAGSIEELADILEIIHALAETHHQTFQGVEIVRQNKFLERGGFKNRYFLISTE